MFLKYFLLIFYFHLGLNETEICGLVPSVRIIGGSTIHYPWYAAITLKKNSMSKLKIECGGSLITRTNILTAAHCLVLKQNRKISPESLVIHMGIRNACKMSGHGEKFDVSRTIVHPKYETPEFGDDIGIIVLKKKADIIPVCLPQPSSKLPSSAEVIGMGLMNSITETTPCELKGADINVINSSQCQMVYRFFDIPNDIICAGSRSRDSCNGDSGSALQYAGDNHLYTIYGIVSFGIGITCNLRLYAMYADVRKYLTWIEDNVEGN